MASELAAPKQTQDDREPHPFDRCAEHRLDRDRPADAHPLRPGGQRHLRQGHDHVPGKAVAEDDLEHHPDHDHHQTEPDEDRERPRPLCCWSAAAATTKATTAAMSASRIGLVVLLAAPAKQAAHSHHAAGMERRGAGPDAS